MSYPGKNVKPPIKTNLSWYLFCHVEALTKVITFFMVGLLQGNHDNDDGIFTLLICCLFRYCLFSDFFDNAPDKDLFDGARKYFYNATDKDFYDGASAA